MKIDTDEMKQRLRKDLVRIEELKARLEARMEAIEVVEKIASELGGDGPSHLPESVNELETFHT